MTETLRCWDFGLREHCCGSCHEDYDEYGYSLCYPDSPHEGYDAEVCCSVNTRLDAMDRDTLLATWQEAINRRKADEVPYHAV